ncbi:hypothetical protein A8C56_13375 [Niabella ginsenosidivorans]|uniref:Uncharacterized protein n=1 Tax=Niabella ginsenosidivorans TaxID=1176587 RepID=A0A1A9I2J1_9BACT|nr:hypothetical protein [Niabella ginsenosidivorans]ANH81836.1 hypothetical protein A8C56_13375 [Niabella ginsenosidivorans]
MKKIVFAIIILCTCTGQAYSQRPRIVNIVNFIRDIEPRDVNITKEVLYQTVVKQIALMEKYQLGGTFLLQYDALTDPQYEKLLKALPETKFEVGAWWEIPQPLVEKAGLKWRGRYPWDWHADVGFSTGYTPAEREKLIDVYMADFKKVFGYYPKSVASWFIDAHSLNYMYEKYHIVASANCKDQYGTDGYTLWGGYWNQAYYPSKVNSYMPAQNEAAQIPVPVFRMLGSDPVRQYDTGLEHERQGVITLEPVYGDAGGDSTWVHWFLREFVNGASMAFAYTQAGQENSFTWPAMKNGLEIQFSLMQQLRDQGKIKVETLAESGAWFKKNFRVTPATAVTVNKDLPGSDKKTVWFDSRFYRANLLWQQGTLRFRDIHLFNENLMSPYFTKPVSSNECRFFTLPIVDGYLWSSKEFFAGLRFKTIINNKEVDITGNDPVITDKMEGVLQVSWPLKNIKGTLQILFKEDQLEISVTGNPSVKWFLDLAVAKDKNVPFVSIERHLVNALSEGISYQMIAKKGSFKKGAAQSIFQLHPQGQQLQLLFKSSGNNKS